MLSNYIKIALRNLWRNKFYVSVNILGLGLALACCIVAYLNWKFDHDFDAFHEHKDQIFKVNVVKESNDRAYGISPLPLGAVANDDIAGVEACTRIASSGTVVKSGERVFNESIHFTDPNFFEVFTFELLEGSFSALKEPGKVIITEDKAEKYFGTKHALGQPLTFYAGGDYQRDLTVGAVVKKPPLNSSIYFGFVCSFEDYIIESGQLDMNDWSWFIDATFYKLNNPSDAPLIAEQLNEYVGVQNKAREDWKIKGYELESMNTIAHTALHMYATRLRESLPESAVWGPIVMAILLLLTACLNFANTTVAFSNKRLKEMGVRKVMGGSKMQIMSQLLSECLFVCVLALGVALVLTEFFVPLYNSMWPFLDINLSYLDNLPLISFLFGTVIITALIAGSYPAFYISSFNASNIFRGGVKFGGSNLFSRVLLGLQLSISLMAIIGALGFMRNAIYQQNSDFGYDRESLITVPVNSEQEYVAFKNAIRQNPKVESIGGTRQHVGYWIATVEYEIKGENHEGEIMQIGENYLQTIGMQVMEGRGLDENRETDFQSSALVNQKFAKEHGWEEAVGQKLTYDSTQYEVVGLLEDFTQSNQFNPIDPIFMILNKPNRYQYLLVRSDPKNLLTLNEELKKEWNALFPFRPYDGFFQNEILAEALLVTNNIKWMYVFFAIATILLTITGLFALVSLNILKRLKEIAVRKIVGASLGNIAILINKNYFWIFIVAAIMGSLGGTYFTNMILQSIFADSQGANPLVMFAGSFGLLLLAGLTVGYKIMQVGRINPADILRSE